MQAQYSTGKQCRIFSQFFEYSDVLGAVSECVSTSLADKTSLGDAEKLENNCVCRGISEPISKANGFLCKTAKRRILLVHAFSSRFFFRIYSSIVSPVCIPPSEVSPPSDCPSSSDGVSASPSDGACVKPPFASK